MTITECRSCGEKRLRSVIDLGMHPLNNALLTTGTLNEPEPRYPLELLFCEACAQLQISETIPADVLYRRDYPYFSSSSKALVEHARQHVQELIADRDLGRDSLIVEIASNDGYLLQHFVEVGIPVVGIDPAEGPAKVANEKGVDTLCAFFTPKLADDIIRELRGQADVIIASNVIAHVDDINTFVAGFKRLLKPDGIAVFEFAYAVDTVEKNEFDQIYHEHLFYHTLTSIRNLMQRHGLYLQDAQHLDIHGGSLRVRVTHAGSTPTLRLRKMLLAEHEMRADRFDYYANFAANVHANLAALVHMLCDIRWRPDGDANRIACYGAASKGATLLNTLVAKGMAPDFFEFVVDQNPFKQGKFMPGVKLPILPPAALLARTPSHCLMLSWNFQDEILATYEEYRRRGGTFIVPVPRPQLFGPL